MRHHTKKLAKLAALADTISTLDFEDRGERLREMDHETLANVAWILAARLDLFTKRSSPSSIAGAEIKALRERLGITQKELAGRIGVAPNSLARYERDELRPAGLMALRLAVMLRRT